MLKEDEILMAQGEARAEGRKEGRVDMLIKIAEIFSDEQLCFPGFTGSNLKLALNELGLRFGRGQGKRFILTNEDSGKYRFNQYNHPTVGDTVEIAYPAINTIMNNKIITIIKPYIKKV